MMELKENGSVLHDAEIVLRFNDVTVWLPERKSWWRTKVIKERVTLLRNVTGSLGSGDFVAVIGPSGSGKTTFLVSLAGKCALPCSGSVLLNDTNVKDLAAGVIEIVPQFEVFVESLSVFEHLNFMLQMKLGISLKALKIKELHSLLDELKLKVHVNTQIRSLSGGERRLLSIASSLISHPKVIICDEPTTGLDSYNAAMVVGVLKNLTSSGTMVICSVHQPSSNLFKEFNSIMLLAEGSLLFHGSHESCEELFESIELKCPLNYNPAEFYVRTISAGPSLYYNLEKISSAYQNQSINDVRNEIVYDEIPFQRVPFRVSRQSWCLQVWLLVWRSCLTLKRNKMRHFIEFAMGVILSAIIIGVSYIGVSGTSQQGIQDIRGLLWLITSEIAFGIGYTSLVAFEFDLTLFKRESGLYSSSAYYLSRMICLIPKCVVWPISYVVLASMAVDLPNQMITAASIALTLVGTGLASASYGLSLGALFTSSHLTTEVMPFMDTILVVVSGVFLRISTLPIWLHGFKYISHFYYGMDAISNIYWRQIKNIDCTWNTTCVSDGVTVLKENGYSNDYLIEDSLGLILITVGWCIIGYCGLWIEERKGYAY